MHISITPYRINLPGIKSQLNVDNNNSKNNTLQFTGNSLAQLQSDCVSFSGNKKNKSVENQANVDDNKIVEKLGYGVGMDINSECQQDLKKLLSDLKKGLKGIIESDKNPDLPILRGEAGIHGRVKKAESILQKSPQRGLRQKKEIFKMGDVIGVRIVLKSSTQQDLDIVFKELGKMVKSGKLKVVQVENYRLTPNDSYVSQKTLNAFERTCNKANQYPEITSKPRKSGYTAIHMTLELPNGKLAEIQIMGCDMEKVKDIEDFFYKKRDNKALPDKYKPIEDMLNRVMGKTKKDKETGKISYEKLDDFQTETLERYIRDSYAHARQVPPKKSKKAEYGEDYFLPIPYSLPRELSFENIQKLKDICDFKNANKTQ